jgi:hypothetical protein
VTPLIRRSTSLNLALLKACDEAAGRKRALTLSASQQKDWARLCMAGLGVEVWSWRIQDRDWENNSEPLRCCTIAGEAALKA